MNRNGPCPCGSGKRYKHCHGSVGLAASEAMPDARSALHAEARAAQRAGALSTATRLYRQLIAAHPDDVDAIHALGVVQFERFRYDEALHLLCDAAERTRWAEPVVRRNLGLVLGKLLTPQANARQEANVAAFAERERARKAEPAVPARVSVVLLTHGDPRMTERAANSVTEQTYRNVELIIADDIQPTATAGAGMERIEHPAAAANAGAQKASGSYLAFLDASDWLAPSYIERMVAEMARARPLWGFSQVENVDARGDVDPQDVNDQLLSRNLPGGPAPSQSDFPVDELPSFTLLSRSAGGGNGNLFVQRDLFLRLGGYRDVDSHDWDFCVRAGREVEPVVIDQRLYFRGRESRPGASDRRPNRGPDGPEAQRRRSDALVAEALSGDAGVTNELCPQHPANRTLVLRAVLRANRGDRVPVPVLRDAATEWRARLSSARPVVSAQVQVPEEQGAGKVALIVLGVYRSGTSALARVLNLCGAALAERLMAARLEINPRGFWEAESIVDLDAQILRLLGVDWKRVDFTLPQEGPLVDEFLAGAREILEAEYRTGHIIVIKDPRVCLLAPLWHRALEASGYRPAYLVSVRHPLEVARSLARSLRAYGGMPIEQGLAVWQSYMERAEAFVATVDARTVHVAYEELLIDWRRTVRRIARQLDVSLDVDSRAAEVDAYLEPGMRSQRAEGLAISEDPTRAQGDTIGALHARLLERCTREAAG